MLLLVLVSPLVLEVSYNYDSNFLSTRVLRSRSCIFDNGPMLIALSNIAYRSMTRVEH